MLRKNLQRTLLVLSLVFLFSLGVMAEAPDYLTESGFPIVTEPITIKMLAGQSAGHKDFKDLLVWQEYEKLTGIEIHWDMVPTNVLTEKRNLIIVSGEYPDAFHSARLTANDLMWYGQQGIFIPLNDLIDKYAPNFKKILDENPTIRRGLTMPDGNIYSLSGIYDPAFKSVLSSSKPWINEEFLDALGMDLPETTDDLYEYLVGVRDNDLNGNGMNDEIPLTASGDNNLFNIMKGYFGLGNRGRSHETVDIDPVSGELRFIPTAPEYKALLEYLHKLYSEELITQDIYTVTSAEVTARAEDGVYGVMITTNPATAYNQHQYIAIPTLTAPVGEKLYSNVTSPLVNIGAFVITDKNKHPEATIRWADYFYGDEGAKLFFMGTEGFTFETLEDGSVEFTDLINNNPDGLSFTQAVSTYIPYRNGGYPAIVKEAFFKGSEGHPDAIVAAEQHAPYYPETIWAPFSFTEDEREVMSSIGDDIDTYIKEMRAKFMTGQESLDNWDSYVRTIQRMGLDYYMDAYQNAYDRYMQD